MKACRRPILHAEPFFQLPWQAGGGMSSARGPDRPRFHRLPNTRSARPRPAAAPQRPKPVSLSFHILDNGLVEVRTSDGKPASPADAGPFIAANAALLRKRLEAFVAEREREHRRRLAEHRHIRRTSADTAARVPRYTVPRPREPLLLRAGPIVRWLGRSGFAAIRHLRHVWEYHGTLAAWKRGLGDHKAKNADQTADIKRLLMGEPETVRENLTTHLKTLTWVFSLSPRVKAVRNGMVELAITFPNPSDFPQYMHAVAPDGLSAPPTKRSKRDLLDEYRLYQLSVGVRVAAECFAEIPAINVVQINRASPALGTEEPLVYERHRWLIPGLPPSDTLDPQPFHNHMKPLHQHMDETLI